ncbi:MFS transporter [Sulfitobacter sp. KE34]|uniref:MFS transporter n=1 Tax=Sulfitobacter faviae TaxID=1775881 RepID=A0AAX3LLF2_9RHOB|nr:MULTISPECIES: MFS transporter [Sulfitobacter]MDF3349289.1 MFS transporter [Sulfitobacter sp. KE12]MDF3352960.1 MFS transporter [Sulfitobacter sp. KE27]MDF3356607.1 MFS transporter [Sulfitobacter sp. KE33]MDF3364031.1 MFS transporter [Sulfitobacter sp. Ks34]MDF3367640.1 MFS transporter [Sulfitobacter sp. Ks43]
MSKALIISNRNYRLLLSASSVSNLGDGIAMVALPWLATMLTSDPLFIAGVATAQRLPWLLFSLPVGVWTDRADRRLLMFRADLVRVALMVFTVLMIVSQTSMPPTGSGFAAILSLTVIAFLFGSAEVVRDNAAQTVLPSIVTHADLERANGQMWSAEQVCGQFIGPPVAGLMIASAVAFPFGVNASIYALSAILIWLIALPPRSAAVSSRFLPALLEGFGWMRRNPIILRLAIMLGAINAVFIGGMTVLVLYAQEVLHLSATGYGLLLTVGAMGGVAGGFLAPVLAGRLGMKRSLLAALCTFTIINLILGFFASPALAGIALFLEAAAGMLWNVVTVSYRQRLIPDELLGRVNSVYRFFGWGAMPFGAMGSGALVAALTPAIGRLEALHTPYLFAAFICALLAVFAIFRLRFD